MLLWGPTHGPASVGLLTNTNIEQLCEDFGCHAEDLPRAILDREEWRGRVMAIRAISDLKYILCVDLKFIYEYISSSSGRAGSTDRHDSLPPLLPIRHRSWQVLRVASRFLAELLDVGLRRLSRSGASVCGGPQEHVAY